MSEESYFKNNTLNSNKLIMENKRYYEMSINELVAAKKKMDKNHPCYNLVSELINSEAKLIMEEEEKETIKMDLLNDTL